MRTETINIYSFAELSETAQQKAIEKNFDINVDHHWWEGTYDDAANIGMKITSFDTGRGNYVNAEISYPKETANKILSDHGEIYETHKTAIEFLKDYDLLVSKYSEGTEAVTEDNEYEFDQEANALEEEFRKSLCEDYRIILQNEYEYLMSKEAIIETIEANEYEFTENGEIY